MGLNLCDKKINIGCCEVDGESFAAGVVAAAGIGCIVFGIRNILQSYKLKRIENDFFDVSFDEEREYEEYKFKREQKVKKRRKNKLKSGIAGVAFGMVSATLGILYFTPCRKYFLDSTAVSKIKEVNVPARIRAVRESDIIDKIKAVDFSDKIDKIKAVDLSDKIDKIKKSKGDAVKVIVSFPKNVLDYIK